jgi:hypothetical protein
MRGQDVPDQHHRSLLFELVQLGQEFDQGLVVVGTRMQLEDEMRVDLPAKTSGGQQIRRLGKHGCWSRSSTRRAVVRRQALRESSEACPAAEGSSKFRKPRRFWSRAA